MSDEHFLSKEKTAQAFCYHSPFPLCQNSASQLVQKTFLTSDWVIPLGFSTEILSHGTILNSMSYISISRLFIQKTWFEFLLHLVILN